MGFPTLGCRGPASEVARKQSPRLLREVSSLSRSWKRGSAPEMEMKCWHEGRAQVTHFTAGTCRGFNQGGLSMWPGEAFPPDARRPSRRPTPKGGGGTSPAHSSSPGSPGGRADRAATDDNMNQRPS